MRLAVSAGLVAAAAAAGGAVALVLGAASGLVGGTTTVLLPRSGVAAPARPVRPLLGNGFDPAAIYARRAAGVVTLYADLGRFGSSQGSGFVVDARGTILTSAHVVTTVAVSSVAEPATALYVEFNDRERLPGRVVGWDVFSDVAVVRVEPAGRRLQPVPLGESGSVVVGAPVAAIGSPFDEQSSLSVGVVSAVGRSIDSLTSRFRVSGAIQIDAPINRGNSGGPLFDAAGRVIGINAQIRSSTGAAEGVGFAIPIDLARRALEQITTTGRVRYAYVGVTTQDVTPGLSRRFALGAEHGALVASVAPGGPAERAGIRGGARAASYNGMRVTVGGDVIVRIGGTPVRSAEDLSRALVLLAPGQRVPVVLFRQGSGRAVVQLVLAERSGSTG